MPNAYHLHLLTIGCWLQLLDHGLFTLECSKLNVCKIVFWIFFQKVCLFTHYKAVREGELCPLTSMNSTIPPLLKTRQALLRTCASWPPSLRLKSDSTYSPCIYERPLCNTAGKNLNGIWPYFNVVKRMNFSVDRHHLPRWWHTRTCLRSQGSPCRKVLSWCWSLWQW